MSHIRRKRQVIWHRLKIHAASSRLLQFLLSSPRLYWCGLFIYSGFFAILLFFYSGSSLFFFSPTPSDVVWFFLCCGFIGSVGFVCFLVLWCLVCFVFMGFSYPIHPVSYTLSTPFTQCPIPLSFTPLLNFLPKHLSSSPLSAPSPRLSQFLCNLQIFDVVMTFI